MATRKRRNPTRAVSRRSAARTRGSTASAIHGFALAPTVSLPALKDDDGRSDRTFRQLLYDIATAATHLESARSFLASRVGVTPPQYNIVMIVAQYGGRVGISVSEVAAHLHVTNTFVTNETHKLVKLGLVSKGPNPLDARGVLLRLSAEGERRVRKLEPDLLLVNDHLFRRLSQRDFRDLARIVAALIGDFAQTMVILSTMPPSNTASAGPPYAMEVPIK